MDDIDLHHTWAAQSEGKLDQARGAKDRVKNALLSLEQKHADKVAAIAAERRRQEMLAAQAAAAAQREKERRAREAFKAQQAADLKAKQDALHARKRGEANALKEATANFNAARKAENWAVWKGRILFEISKSQSDLQNAFIACSKQHKSWFVAVKACEMRLERREQRPPSELIVDAVQTSLEKELGTLNDARNSLKSLVDEGEKLCGEMKHTVHMIVTSASRENVSFRRTSSTPHLPPIDSGSPSATSKSDFQKTLDKMFNFDFPSQDELLDVGRTHVKRAIDLAVECAGVLINCRNNVQKAMAGSNAALDERKASISAIRKSLEKEKLEVEGSLRDAAHRITMLKMRAQHVPQSPEDEEEIRACHDLVKDLKEAKDLLEDDWRAKSSAFTIDSFCRNLTPKIAATMFKLPGSPTANGNDPDETQKF